MAFPAKPPTGIDVPGGNGWDSAPGLQRVPAPPPGGHRAPPMASQGNRPPQLEGRYPAANRLNQFQLPHGRWMPITVDRPTILWPIRATIAAAAPSPIASGAFYPIYYRPLAFLGTVPAQMRSADTDPVNASQVSVGAGVVYLPQPGLWYLFTGAPTAFTNTTDVTDLIMIDASDTGVAARYMAEPGCHRIPVNTTVTATAPDSVVLLANRNRTGLLIVNPTVGGNTARLGFGAAAVAGAGGTYPLFAPAAAGAVSQFSMFGPYVFKGDIHAVRDAALDAPLQVIEWE